MTTSSDRSPIRVPAWCGWGLFALTLAILLHRLDDGAVPRAALFHPEAIYPAAIYLDLENWSTWNTPFAPYFFPDMPVFFFCMWSTGNATAATYAFGALQLTLLVSFLYRLFGSLVASDARTRRLVRRFVVLSGIWLAVSFSFNVHGDQTFLQLFAAAFHTGSFVLTIAGLAILVEVVQEPFPTRSVRGGALVALLLSLTFLGVFSDKLSFVTFVLPAAVALLVRWLGDRSSGRLPWVAAALLLAGFLGIQSVSWVNLADGIRIAPFDPIDPARVVGSLLEIPEKEESPLLFVLERFFGPLGFFYRAFWFSWLAVMVALVFAARDGLARRRGFRNLARLPVAARGNLAFFAVFTVTSFVLTALATTYLAVGHHGAQVGLHDILFIPRYLISLYTVPLVSTALLLPVLLGTARAARLELPQLAILLALTAVLVTRLDFENPFPSYQPPLVRCLDEKAAENGLKYGLAHFYSHARRINVFSNEGLHADQVTRDLEPISWIDSRSRAGEDHGYDFVVTDRLRSENLVIEKIGAPDHELDCEGVTVFVYDEPRYLPGGAGRRPPAVGEAGRR